MTTSEPRWLDEDRGWLLAVLAEQAETCRGCGLPMDETYGPASAQHWRIVEARCQACAVLEADADNAAERPTAHRYGRRAGVVRT